MKPHLPLLHAVVLVLIVSGCATQRAAVMSSRSPLGAAIPAYRPPTHPDANDRVPDAAPPNELTLSDALALALLHNPELRSYAWEVRAREAHALQAGLRPNPEIGADLENLGTDGTVIGADIVEATVGLSQLVELGGDRRNRLEAAAAESDLAGWNYQSVRLDVLTGTVQAFTGLLAAQERLVLVDSLRSYAQQFYQSVAARVEAGKVSALEERRAQVVFSMALIEKERATRNLAVWRYRLSAFWGSSAPAFDRAVGSLDNVDPVPSYERLVSFVDRNPDVARWRDEMLLREADVELEQARSIPDPTLVVGARRLRELGRSALVAGISIPLPLFDRNQGAIREARYRMRQGVELQSAAMVEAQLLLAEAYERLASAYVEATTLRHDVVPAAEENFGAAEEGYVEGKFDLLTVLDAQRTLFEVTNQYIDALAAYHAARAEVERFIGTPLSEIQLQ